MEPITVAKMGQSQTLLHKRKNLVIIHPCSDLNDLWIFQNMSLEPCHKQLGLQDMSYTADSPVNIVYIALKTQRTV